MLVEVGLEGGAVVVVLTAPGGRRGEGDAALDTASHGPLDLDDARRRVTAAMGRDALDELPGPLRAAAEGACLELGLAPVDLTSAEDRWARVASPLEALAAIEAGASGLEVDVGHHSLAELDYLLARLRARLGPGPRLGIDARGAWDLHDTLRALPRLAAHAVAWVRDAVPPSALPLLSALRDTGGRAGKGLPGRPEAVDTDGRAEEERGRGATQEPRRRLRDAVRPTPGGMRDGLIMAVTTLGAEAASHALSAGADGVVVRPGDGPRAALAAGRLVRAAGRAVLVDGAGLPRRAARLARRIARELGAASLEGERRGA